MQKHFILIFLRHEGMGSIQSVTGITQSRQDQTILGQDGIDMSDGKVDVGMSLTQRLESVVAGNDRQDVNLFDSPLLKLREKEYNDVREWSYKKETIVV